MVCKLNAREYPKPYGAVLLSIKVAVQVSFQVWRWSKQFNTLILSHSTFLFSHYPGVFPIEIPRQCILYSVILFSCQIKSQKISSMLQLLSQSVTRHRRLVYFPFNSPRFGVATEKLRCELPEQRTTLLIFHNIVPPSLPYNMLSPAFFEMRSSALANCKKLI